MKELVRTVVSLGLVSENQVREFQRWGLVDHVLAVEKPPKDRESIESRMNLAIDVVGMDRKETELSIPALFLETGRKGWIHVHLDGVDVREPLEIMYGRTRHGEYILPWGGASGQEDILTNGKTYLETEDSRVYMMDTRSVYFDDLQSFVVCKPGSEEARDGQR